MFGFLNLNKPLHWTSHDCVAKVRRLLREKRVGHGGTLDPLASGVLPIAVGRATRLLNYLPTRKVYRAKIRFGLQTSTDDLAGTILQDTNASGLSLQAVEAQLPSFLGQITQIPPQYSAIQVNGQRLYDLARAGKMVEVPSRQVEVFALDVLDWQGGQAPELTLQVACGEGTYIRAIARDLGQALGVGGTLAGLERLESGGMRLDQGITLEQLADSENPENLLQSAVTVLAHLPQHHLGEQETRFWFQGKSLPLSSPIEPTYLMLDDQGNCVGIGHRRETESGWFLQPKVVLAP
ncbi:tRNA pseudouridine(55) synthase TruB [Synechocystis sp. LKSZ1]|uniref:tRNA pseudouridine(55) synthase TruB n=1 Tax=Synechocystis sp. LKSZ1 TaxID=3144951 RepID=UPI00336BC76B